MPAAAMLQVETASVTTDENCTSSSYVDLTTSGPSVTITTGVTALVMLNATVYASAAGVDGFMSFAVSGATTIAASDANSGASMTQGAYDNAGCITRIFKLTSLTAGANTFTCKYRRSTAGTAIFKNRSITVFTI